MSGYTGHSRHLTGPGTITNPWGSSVLVRWKARALGKRDKPVTSCLEFRDDVRKNLIGSRFFSLVVKSQDVIRMLGDESVIGSLALGGGRAGRITRVEVPQDERLVTLGGNLLNKAVVVTIRRPHERRIDTRNAHESLFNEPHLIMDLVKAECGEIRVRPGVGLDLVATLDGRQDTVDVVLIIDTTIVVSIEEECSRGTSSIQGVENCLVIDVRAIIKGQSDGVGNGAAGDDLCLLTLGKVSGVCMTQQSQGSDDGELGQHNLMREGMWAK